MGGIHIYPVRKGFATVQDDGGLRVQLYYDSHDTAQSTRMPGDPEWGEHVFHYLMTQNHAQIATKDFPARSPAGGAMYFLDDGSFFSHRRDIKAPTHKGWHSIQGGFPSNERQTLYPEEICIAEGAELLLTTADSTYLLVPKEDPVAESIALDLARKINIKAQKILQVSYERIPGPDRLEIYRDDDLVSVTNGYVEFMSESETAVNLLQRYKIHHDPKDILPIDTEGMRKGDNYIHFNREVFRFTPQEIKRMQFGNQLENPLVYRVMPTEDSRISQQQHRAPADMPYIYKPDDMLEWMLASTNMIPVDRLEHFKAYHHQARRGERT